MSKKEMKYRGSKSKRKMIKVILRGNRERRSGDKSILTN